MKTLLMISVLIGMFCSSTASFYDSKIDGLGNNKLFDSIDIAIKESLGKKDKIQAMKLMNKKSQLFFNQGLYTNSILVLMDAINLSDNGRDTVSNSLIGRLYMESLRKMGLSYIYLSDYDAAVNCYIMMDKYNIRNDIEYKASFYNGMGAAFTMNKKFNYGREYCRKAINLSKSIKDENSRNPRLFSIYSNIAGLFSAKGEFDSAQIYMTKAQELAVITGNSDDMQFCLTSMGSLNGEMGRYELAINYYKEAYRLIDESSNKYTLPFIKLNIAECYIRLGKYDSAFPLAMEGLELANKDKIKNLQIMALHIIADLYRENGDYKSSLQYFEKYDKLKDSLFSQENDEKLLKQKTDFDMYKIMMEKDMFDKNVELERSRNIVNKLIATILVILFAIVSAFLTYRLLKQNRENRIKSQKYDDHINDLEDKSRILEDEIKRKDDEISISKFSLAKNSEFVNLLVSKLDSLRDNLPPKNRAHEDLKEINDLIAKFSRQSSVGELNIYLEKVEQDFYDKLDIMYPSMTMGEKRICALISLGLSSKDISKMTGKSRGAIDIVKFRIRKKINVDIDADLESFFFQIRI